MPIEICPWGPLGRDLMVIPCLYVPEEAQHKGVGRALFERHQIPRAIFVNGAEIWWGYEAPKEGIREAILQALSDVPSSQSGGSER
jgi:hypothetical protein